MDKKYELTDESINYCGNTLYRIRACKDFTLFNGYIVHKGDLGGYIECYDNLSQLGCCWICPDVKLFDNARVLDNAFVCGYAIVCYNAIVRDNAFVGGNATVYGYAIVCDNAVVSGYAIVGGNAVVSGYASVGGSTEVDDTVLNSATLE